MPNLLHDLLQQDQEPFHLRDYIADRRTKLRASSTKHQQQLTNSGGKSSTNHFPVTFCKNACFSGKHDSPDLTRASPVLFFPKSPVKLLQIPSRTAALLLEAASRINKSSSTKHAHRIRTDFGFFGSVLKKLTFKTQKRNDRGLEASAVPLPEKNIFRRDASGKSASGKRQRDLTDSEEASSYSDVDFCGNGRRRDSAWSEDKSLDTETSCSSRNSDVTQFCEEQQLTQSPSGCHSPDFSFRPPSPSRRTVKDEDDELKEQCSPVCVLDPLFEDEDDTHEGHEDGCDGYDLGCSSYASVQRKKHQLLQKLRRFEALAALDPKVIERMILGDEPGHDSDTLDENYDDLASEVPSVDESFAQVLEKSGFHDLRKIPADMKRLVSDLIAEEEPNKESPDDTNCGVVNRVCARLESWKDVQPNTIDMMVDRDFKQESRRWRSSHGQTPEVAMEVELAIFGSLVQEVLCELIQ